MPRLDRCGRLRRPGHHSFVPQTEYDQMADTLEAIYSGVRDKISDWQADGTLPSPYRISTAFHELWALSPRLLGSVTTRKQRIGEVGCGRSGSRRLLLN